MRVKCHQSETGKQKTLHGPRRAVERAWKRLEAEGWVLDSPTAEKPAGAEGSQLELDVELLTLPGDLEQVLRDAGYATLRDLQQAGDEDLLAVDGIGPKRLAEIREAIDEVLHGD